MRRTGRGRPRAVSTVLLVGGLAAGCSRSPSTVAVDLAGDLAIADRRCSARVILFGTPDADPVLDRGFFNSDVAPNPERFAWARREASLHLNWPDRVPREAVIDLAPYPGLGGQTAEVRLNDSVVARIAFEERSRHRFELPIDQQKSGENRLAFVFEKVAPPGNPLGRRIAASVFSLSIAEPGDPLLRDLLATDTPAPFRATLAGDRLSLTLLAPSSVRYAFRIPPKAELRFTPEVRAATRSAGGARCRILFESAGHPPREIWTRSIGPGREFGSEVVIPLDGPTGTIAGLTLEVSAESSAWLELRAPRVTSPAAAVPALRSPSPNHEPRGVEPLRRALHGMNVLLVVLDAGRADHFGCYGYPRATTPTIDRMASEGVVFEQAYTTAVYTLSAMASIWTSLYPDEHHRGVAYDAPLPHGPLTLAELLSSRGFATAGFVANGVAGPGFGLDRGFTEFHEIFREHGHGAGAFAKVVPSWLSAHRDRRFFAYLHFREPHFPLDAPPPFDTRFGPDRPLPRWVRSNQDWFGQVNTHDISLTPAEVDHLVRLYDGNLAFADEQVGLLRQALESLGLLERTVIVITADHGEALLEHGFVGHNKQVFEESTRVPLIVRFPAGSAARGVRVKGLVDSLDLAPTVADVFGLASEGAARGFEGQSLLPVALGAPGASAVFTRTASGERSIYSLRDDRFTFIRNLRTGKEQLYDRHLDPGEHSDLVGGKDLQAVYYRQQLFRWLLRVRGGIEAEGGERAELTPQQIENLRALGYLR